MKASPGPLLFICVSSILLLLSSPDSHSAQISPQLIEQAKNMPASERARLARQYGITLPGVARPAAVPDFNERVGQLPIEPDLLGSDGEPGDTSEEDADTPNRFGMSLFSARNSMYVPSGTSLVPENYRLGPGDTVRTLYFGKETADVELEVDQQGRISLPRIGPIAVAGLTFDQATALVQREVNSQLIGTEVVVSLAKLRQISVFVAGEVARPGQYNLSSLSSVTQALYTAGGISALGTFREIKVNRGGEQVQDLDLYDLLLRGDRSGDIGLKNGDTVFVPTAGNLITIEGEVLRPAIYEMLADETFAQLVRNAGGLTGQAYQQGFQLVRLDKSIGIPRMISVTDVRSSLVLQNGDKIRVDRVTDQFSNPVRISGAVVRPGVYEHREGARLSDYLQSVRRDFLRTSDTRVGLVVRQINAELDIEPLVFSPIQALGGDEVQNFKLQPFDEVIVLPLPDLEALTEFIEEDSFPGTQGMAQKSVKSGGEEEENENSPTRRGLLDPIVQRLRAQARAGQPAQIIRLVGAINEPGEYPLVKGAGIEQLLSLAGGVQDGAFLDAVEIRRTSVRNNRAEVSVLIENLSERRDVSLEAGDELRVNFIPGWTQKDVVTLNGEIVFPGDYTLRPGETVGSLIERAGGFTDAAFIESTRYLSKVARERQTRSVQKIINQLRKSASSQSLGDSGIASQGNLAYLDQLDDNIEGRVVIDLPRILAGDASADITLQDGDEIIVPKLTSAVFLVGEVLEPGNYRHVEGRSVEDYIGLAAGYSETAKKKDVYIIEPNGMVRRLDEKGGLLSFNDRRSLEISPGSTIVIPPNLDYTKPLDLYSQVSSVVFQSLASVAAFFNIARK